MHHCAPSRYEKLRNPISIGAMQPCSYNERPLLIYHLKPSTGCVFQRSDPFETGARARPLQGEVRSVSAPPSPSLKRSADVPGRLRHLQPHCDGAGFSLPLVLACYLSLEQKLDPMPGGSFGKKRGRKSPAVCEPLPAGSGVSFDRIRSLVTRKWFNEPYANEC
ncbi:homoserine kinase [Anopheles sinensis]|uniref:Homoserine kinase n=1 Tax=Anopheles sinensis TaxID=74873 RepID=A0A084WQR9_ANOSI|nr:homoserine kinase [Anopheles sinensis]